MSFNTEVSLSNQQFLETLSDELLFPVFFESFITQPIKENNIESAIDAIKNLSNVCRKFRCLANDEFLWKKLAQTRDLQPLRNLNWKNTSKFYYFRDQLCDSIDKIEDKEKKAKVQILLISLYGATNSSFLQNEIEKVKGYIGSIDHKYTKDCLVLKLFEEYIRAKKTDDAESLYAYFKDANLKARATKKLFNYYLEIDKPEKAKQFLSENFQKLKIPYKSETKLVQYYLNNKQIDKAKEFSDPYAKIEIYKVSPEKQIFEEIKSWLSYNDYYHINSYKFGIISGKEHFLFTLFSACASANNIDEAIELLDKIDDVQFRLDMLLQFFFKNDIQIQKARDLINQLHNYCKAIYQIRFMKIFPTDLEIDKAITFTNETKDSYSKTIAQRDLINALIELKKDKKAKDFITIIRKNRDYESLFDILNACLKLKDTIQAKDLINEIYADRNDPAEKGREQINLLKVYLELKDLNNAYNLIADIKNVPCKSKAQLELLNTLIELKDIKKINALIATIDDPNTKAKAKIKLISINPIDKDIKLVKEYLNNLIKSGDFLDDLFAAESFLELSQTLLKLNKLDEAKSVISDMPSTFIDKKNKACIEFIQKATQLNEIKMVKELIKSISDPYQKAQMQVEFMKEYFQLD